MNMCRIPQSGPNFLLYCGIDTLYSPAILPLQGVGWLGLAPSGGIRCLLL